MKVVDAEQSQLDDGFPLCVCVPHHHLCVHHCPTTTLPHAHTPPRALLVTRYLEVLRRRHDLLGRASTSSEAPPRPKISTQRLRGALTASVVPRSARNPGIRLLNRLPSVFGAKTTPTQGVAVVVD